MQLSKEQPKLLGISSKRLCAILDGAEPPSDTESSSGSPDQFETISLDSISSDEEILSQDSSRKKKHKHKHRDLKSKSKKKRARESSTEDVEQSKASRAGLTVLELLELQARARAIRAQLQQEQLTKQQTETEVAQSSSSDGEVEIKEEPAEVLIISSSEDEKPDLNELQKEIPPKEKELPKESSKQMKKDKKKKEKGKKDKKDKDVDKDKRKDSTTKDTEQNTSKVPENVKVSNESPQKITKKINDLIITVPQQATRKIKLNRNKVTVSVSKENNEEPNRIVKVTDDKSKKKKRRKRINADKDSDHDEITLQLSDTEKMDLLEDFDRKSYDVVSSTSNEDTDSSADTESDSNNSKNTSKDSLKDTTIHDKHTSIEIKDPTKVHEIDNKLSSNEESVKQKSLQNPQENNKTDSEDTITETETFETIAEIVNCPNKTVEVDISETNNQNRNPDKGTDITGFISETVNKNVLTIQNIDDIPVINKEPEINSQAMKTEISENKVAEIDSMEIDQDSQAHKIIEKRNSTDALKPKTQDTEKNLSEGELSEHNSSEIEALDLKPEVVCISDDEKGSAKKKKKKDKKKKDKKSKKKDFRESADENFYRYSDCLDKNNAANSKVTDNSIEVTGIEPSNTAVENTESINVMDDDVYEILELSDDSSCYEVEGTVLSKEPTVEEIAALSAKIDEIGKEEREEVITEEEIKEFERKNESLEADDNIENISWKDRYLDSKKVKKVLSTSNILNALRKKNKELKNKLEEKRKQEEKLKQKEKENEAKKVQKIEAEKELVEETLEEGSIGHYNTLQGSTKYVDPVKEIDKTEETSVEKQSKEKQIEGDDEDNKNDDENAKKGVTGEMKKDAKQLLKMYKKLLKYNDMNKQKHKDPNKKKKKKSKKKESSKESVSA
ncbi:DNA ligase 1 [Hyposmocoma kahamanoa]|uniref:DNA ligase 1 n=1 Tax=Hyposmocoma kahamanoa TaxID=1477025 RepID=UPI000E6D78CA|nr:DNA ligase 1 [Hyposmocoma kahamanoa]